jgi:hypothetical protein
MQTAITSATAELEAITKSAENKLTDQQLCDRIFPSFLGKML